MGVSEFVPPVPLERADRHAPHRLRTVRGALHPLVVGVKLRSPVGVGAGVDVGACVAVEGAATGIGSGTQPVNASVVPAASTVSGGGTGRGVDTHAAVVPVGGQFVMVIGVPRGSWLTAAMAAWVRRMQPWETAPVAVSA